jgi:hypothetical protein
MTDRMHHQLELAGRTATLYVSGALSYEHVDTLIAVCAMAPPRARTLRVDLHALDQLSADALDAVRLILHYWRDSRHGDFRLTTSHMVATLREVPRRDGLERSAAIAMPWGVNEALVGTYL